MRGSIGDVIRSTSPQDPADVVSEVAVASERTVVDLLAAAAEARRGWAFASAFDRSAALVRAADRLAAARDELASLIVREVGKPVREAGPEVDRAVSLLRYYAQAALDPDGESLPAADGRSWLLTRRRPRGLVLAITPWNFPIAIPMWKLAPALAWGNTALLKPASHAVTTALRLVEVLDLPAKVLAVVPGGGDMARRLLADDRVAAVSFTGSAGVGREVAKVAADRGVPAQVEMGGSNPVVVLDDADPASAAALIAQASMSYAGQKCTAARRVIATRGVAPALRDALTAAVGAMVVGEPTQGNVSVGPVIDERARAETLDAARQAVSLGGRILVGGRRLERTGWFLEPTVVEGAPSESQLERDEVFGPVCSVRTAADDSAALELANDSRYGLVAAVHTRDLGRAMWFADRLEAGLVRVNAATTGVDFHAPFGGDKGSSQGPREQGRAAREFYTSWRTFLVSPP